jgi:hypothetical protein
MDSPQSNELSRWTQDCAALLTPPAGWEPDPNVARARFEARLHRPPGPKRYWAVGLAGALLVLFAILTIRPTSGFAQQTGSKGWYRLEQAWYFITLIHTRPILTRRGTIPEDAKSLRTHSLTEPGAPEMVANAGEAARRVGFNPRLPVSGVLTAKALLSVHGPMSFGMVLDRAELQSALRTRGVLDQDVPQNWDGSRITLNVGGTVTARWSDVPDQWTGVREWSDMTLTQGLPPVVTAPPGFDLAAFVAIDLRITARVDRGHALALGDLTRRSTTAAALLFDNGARSNARPVREVDLRTGRATLIEDLDNDGHIERVMLLWSVPGRAYVLKGVLSEPLGYISPDLATAFANVIDLANTIE